MIVPACNQTEKPFLVNGRRWLYCYDTVLQKHGYLDVDNDFMVWNRSFHPAFAPEFEFTPEAEQQIPIAAEMSSKNIHPYPNFYF